MHSLHIRLPKNFVLEERLDRYASAIEARPSSFAGRWAEACAPLDEATGALASFREVRLDLGCGKGSFLVGAARREPDVLFLGIDSEPICIAYAAQAVCEAALPNALVIPGTAEQVGRYFGEGELAVVYLNFPTPHPRLRHAHERMTNAAHLIDLRQVIAPGGELVFRTDSLPLWAYTQTQLPLAGYETRWTSEDLRAERPDDPTSGYEEKLGARGARVYGICAAPTGTPLDADALARAEAAIPQGLVDYLPDDLEAMGYVPHGMQATVENLIHRQANAQARKARGARSADRNPPSAPTRADDRTTS